MYYSVYYSRVEIIIIITTVCTSLLELTGIILWPVDLWSLFTRYLGCVCWVELLSKLFEFIQIVFGHRSTGVGHSFFEMSSSNNWDWIIHFHGLIVISRHQLFSLFFSSNGLSNGCFGSSLTKLGHISTGETFTLLSKEI
jgi:hypothetical protein